MPLRLRISASAAFHAYLNPKPETLNPTKQGFGSEPGAGVEVLGFVLFSMISVIWASVRSLRRTGRVLLRTGATCSDNRDKAVLASAWGVGWIRSIRNPLLQLTLNPKP